MRVFLVKKGEEGMAALRRAAGDKSKATINRYIEGESEPTSEHIDYKLALACGCSDEEALALASEASDARKEPA